MKDSYDIKTDLPGLVMMPFIKWSIESRGIFLINTVSKKSQFLDYPQAALWDLLSRGYPYDQIITMLSAILSKDKEGVKTIVQISIEEWLQNGFLLGGNNDGEYFINK